MTNEPILRLHAPTPGDLAELLAAPDADLLALGDAAPAGGAGGCRLGVVAPNAKRLALARKVVGRGKPWRGRNEVWFSPAPLLADRPAGLAFVFPGLEAEFAPQVDDVATWLGVAPPERNVATLGAHAASVLAVGRLLHAALGRLAIWPDAAAGHSIGEWSAMFAGGILSGAAFDDLIGRGHLDRLRVPGVEFAVLGCGVAPVAEAISGRADVVISHENSTNQTVVCGPAAELTEIVDAFRARGVICQVLPFRSGFHTPMLEPYLAPLSDSLLSLDMHPPAVPVWSATTAEPFPPQVSDIGRLSVRHMVEPVRFRGLVEAMHASGIRVFIQAGPGQLGSLIDDTLRESDHLTIAANSTHRSGLAQLLRLAVALWVEGGQPDFAALDANAGRLDPAAADAHGVDDAATVAAAPVAESVLARLHDLGTRVPAAAEFGALLSDVAESVVAVLEAAGAATGAGRPPVAPPAPIRAHDSTLHVSTSTMPYLLDHCLAAQRDGWPDETDRRPVVPATTTIWHMMRAAEQAAPGRTAIGVDDLELHRWLVAAPAQDVAVQTRPVGVDRVHVTVGDFAQATVLLGGPPEAAPAPWNPEPGERPATLRAADLYEQRWMFHGPGFQAVSACRGVADRSARAELTVPHAPGALLDGVGQVLGLWLIEREERWVAFPIHIARIRFHTAEPAPGTRLECSVAIREVDPDAVEADAQLTVAGRVAVSISGWRDRRFDGGGRLGDVHRFPQLSTLSEQQPGGWWLLADPWRGIAARELSLHKYLGAAERDEYHARPVRERRHWLLQRVVVKDAVRGWMWDCGAGPLFPAEIGVVDAGAGLCTVVGRHGLNLPDLDIAVAHCGEIAAATVQERGPTSITIHIEEANHPVTSVKDAFTSLVRNPEGLPARQYLVTGPPATGDATTDRTQRGSKESAP
ncbi:MAG TPA: acyltransferase domain-containing protein [Jatrophihabitantaceae bacterium]